jgi:hypothetical protein
MSTRHGLGGCANSSKPKRGLHFDSSILVFQLNEGAGFAICTIDKTRYGDDTRFT